MTNESMTSPKESQRTPEDEMFDDFWTRIYYGMEGIILSKRDLKRAYLDAIFSERARKIEPSKSFEEYYAREYPPVSFELHERDKLKIKEHKESALKQWQAATEAERARISAALPFPKDFHHMYATVGGYYELIRDRILGDKNNDV